MFKSRPLITILLALGLLAANPATADVEKNRARLKEIRLRIEKAQTDLAKKKHSELKLSRELALLKRTLVRIDKRIKSLKKEQRQLRSSINEQQQLVKKSQRATRKVSRQLEKRLVALYKEGEVGPLKILFAADSPTELVQQYQYLTRVLKHDQELLQEYRVALDTQQQQLTKLEVLQHQQKQLLDREQQQRDTAAEGRKLQARLLSQVRKEKKRLSGELAQLKENAARLQSLMANLKKVPAGPPAPGAVSFRVGKGTLAWPAAGEVLIGFGTQKDSSLGTYYESNGIEIATAIGSRIHAVADGKVVFADWFKGYGNLLILSHAGGYHTLYAQAARLDKKLGDEVTAGTLLGYSGLAGRDAIYFEIRHNGSPVDPLIWLQRR